MAFLTVHIHVRQEVHFDLQSAVAMACFAPATLDIEREPPRTVSTDLRFRGFGEQRADLIPYSGIGGRIGTRSASDRILVNVDHFVALAHTFHTGMLAGHDARTVEFVGKHRVQNLIDQSGFTGTRNTRHASEYSQWEVDRQILQIVFAGSNHAQLLGLTYFATGLRDLDLSAAGNVVARNRTRSVNELFRGTGIDHFAAMLASSRSDVNNPISVFDSVFVMLHNDQRVAKIAQMMQSGDQPLIVTLVQADGWFVEHIHHAHQTGTDLGRQTNTLRLAARQGFGGTRQCQIVQSDVVEESKTGTNLLQHLAGDLRGRPFKLQAVHPCEACLSGHVAHIGNGFPANGHRQHFRTKPTALACLTRYFTHIRFVILLHLIGVGLVMPTHQRTHHAFETGGIFAHTTPTVTIRDLHLEITPIHNGLTGLFRKILPRGVEIETHLIAEPLKHMAIIFAGAFGHAPRFDGVLIQCLAGIGNHQFRINLQLVSDARAYRAGTVRGVERERARLNLIKFKLMPVRACAFFGKRLTAVRILLIQIHKIGHHDTLGELQCGFNGIGQMPSLTTSRSTTTSMVCFFCLVSLMSSDSCFISPSISARA